MDAAQEKQVESPRACPECGAAVAPGQRRCTNCGKSVDARRRLARRTPLIAAITVLALSGAAVVVAQAAVTEQASIDAVAPAEVAAAPVVVIGTSPPPATKPTNTPPEPVTPEAPPATSPSTLEIPSLSSDVVQQAAQARAAAEAAAKEQAKQDAQNAKDGTPVADDGSANPDDLLDAKKLKVVHAENYNPEPRLGVEFGNPKAAIDKRSRTVWDVNVPADNQPFNVGIVLDLGKESKRVSSLRIRTPTPGFGVVIYRTDDEEIPEKIDDRWTRAAKVPSVSDDLVVPITDDGDAKWARYILVYLTTPRSADDTRAAISDLEVLP